MENLRSFIESGILESYVSGVATLQQVELVEQMASSSSEVRAEIESISEALESYALANAVTPDIMVRPFVMATIDYTERMKNGEPRSFPPGLTERSSASEFSEWLNRPDMVLPEFPGEIHARIISYTQQIMTAIVWIHDRTSEEVHDSEYEKFLILEGTCNISVGKEVYGLGPGDFFSIPLHKIHQVVVTSPIPCKVILQRIAA
ncbi:MAG: cupin domain-containing protein [Ferruginibacter sp.]